MPPPANRGVSVRHRFIGDVANQRIGARPALGYEDFRNGGGVGGISAEAIDGFGRKRDQTAGAQNAGGTFDVIHGSPAVAISRLTSQSLAAAVSEQMRNTSCTVPVPV